MYARQFARAARPLKNSFRGYATETQPSGGVGPAVWIGGGLLAAGGGYYYATRSGGSKLPTSVQPSGNQTFKGGDQGFVDLKLVATEEVNHNTKKLRFALPEPGDVSGLKVASALLTKVKREGDEKPTLRPYTPVSDEGEVGFLDLIVKRYEGGPMSEHIHSLKKDDSLAFKGPLPKYPLGANQHNHIALIAGGTGITPMYQLLRAVFNNPEDKTKATLVYGNIKEEDILLKQELADLEAKYPDRFRVFYMLDQPSEGWKGGKGFVTKDLLKTVLPQPNEENIKVFVCGPPGMYKAVSGAKVSPKDQGELSGILKELGYTKDHVYKF